ncbi:hypothetical protein AAAC13_00925 [Pseudomonas aeruginosa]|uniref:hypothetical protein n=1 Tax=Pseudomonas aeruginosa group TaxID=136841 RepID=UPI00071B7480|nr:MULTISPECIES: hypothetical protein [Pseudomonas aeruginosa group]EIU1446668.1 hypothetical protein [Pseudomonas aeruginosa]EKV2978009.1 hypothetical protein [Pseudomonas aeruginosa]EKV3164704.1 hypothetical protein [Pseudomonas aeruginosa]EKW6216192.1 hypothetical protein [Pseudomonas aeruginosa]EKW7605877.1 hypothetical protein [Pseudomonas aeruginosa]
MKTMIVSALAAALALSSATASAVEHQNPTLIVAQSSKAEDVLPKEQHLLMVYLVALYEVDTASHANLDIQPGETLDGFTNRLSTLGPVNVKSQDFVSTLENKPGYGANWHEFGIPVRTGTNGEGLSSVRARTGHGLVVTPMMAEDTPKSAIPATGITTKIDFQLNLPTGDLQPPSEKSLTFTEVFKEGQAYTRSWEQQGKHYVLVVRMTAADPISYPKI